MLAGMKRYRVTVMEYDTTANILAIKIKSDSDPKVKEMWGANHAAIRAGLVATYGAADFDGKLENFCALGAAPFSLVAFHNQFFRQARNAFVIGSYYPALTGICALGERVLNHLVLVLRDDYQHTPEYRRVRRKDSFDNWDVAIDALASWGVLLPDAADKFRKLRDVRNRTLHFNPQTDRDARSEALDALLLFQEIISSQFSALGAPWYIPHAIPFVRRSCEAQPFVRKVVIPNCVLVGPAHTVRPRIDGPWEVLDPGPYPDEEISDDDFVRLLQEAQASQAARPAVPRPL